MESVSFLTDPSTLSRVQLNDIQIQEQSLAADSIVKPRRRLGDTKDDELIGGIIQKTKAIQIDVLEDAVGLGVDEGQWIQALYSHDFTQNYWAVKKIRKYVCGENSEFHVQNLLSWQILSRLRCFLVDSCPENLLFETLWIITNIAAGPTGHTTSIVDNQILPLLNQLLLHMSGSIRTQATWAIGNIVGDREGYRDVVLGVCSLDAILHIWQGEFPDESSRKEAFRICMWVVDNMCRYRPNWHYMEPAFLMIPEFLQHEDPLLLKECCWSVARILHGAGRYPSIDNMITPEFCNRLVEILSYNNMMTTHPLLRAMINLSSSKNSQHLEYIINAGIINELHLIITTKAIPISCRGSLELFSIQVFSNLASHYRFAKYVVDAPIFKRINSILENESSPDLKKEACILIKNIASHKNMEFIQIIIDANILYGIIKTAHQSEKDEKVLYPAMEALIDILSVGDENTTPENTNLFLSMVNSYGGFEVLLGVYLFAAGKNLEEMDHDAHEIDCEERNSSDEEGNASSPKISLKDRLAFKVKCIMRTWFLKKFKDTLQNAQASQELFNRLGSLSMDPESQKGSIMDLINEFSTLMPTYDLNNKLPPKVSNQRSESEVTLS